MNYKVFLTENALNDIYSIYRYISIELQSPKNVSNLIVKIENAIISLDQMPERYKFYNKEKWIKLKLHVMPIDNFLIFYTVFNENYTVKIMRIMYAERDVDKQLEKI